MNCRCHKWTHIEEEKPQDAFVRHDEKRVASVCVDDRKTMYSVLVQHLYCFKQTRFWCNGHQRPRVFQQLIYQQHRHAALPHSLNVQTDEHNMKS